MELTKTQNSDKNGFKRDGLLPGPGSGHGGEIYRTARDLGLPVERIIDFSASVNPLGISDSVRGVIEEGIDALVNYPDTQANDLTEKIAVCSGISPELIVCGNGSTELIYLVPRVLKPGKVLIAAPTFSEYERACGLNPETMVKTYGLKKENDFQIVPGEFIREMQGCDMAFLCNPNNPTGSVLKKDDVLLIAEAAENAGCFLVVDEAFIDFTPEETVVGKADDLKHLLVLRSMTKFYALTGLRIGYAVFNRSLVPDILRFKEPWTVNNLAQKAAAAALEDREYIKKSMDLMCEEKGYMEGSFREMKMDFIPSAANYYLLRMDDAVSKAMKMREKGILVRDCSNFRGLDGSYIRVAVKSREHNMMLLRELSGL